MPPIHFSILIAAFRPWSCGEASNQSSNVHVHRAVAGFAVCATAVHYAAAGGLASLVVAVDAACTCGVAGNPRAQFVGRSAAPPRPRPVGPQPLVRSSVSGSVRRSGGRWASAPSNGNGIIRISGLCSRVRRALHSVPVVECLSRGADAERLAHRRRRLVTRCVGMDPTSYVRNFFTQGIKHT